MTKDGLIYFGSISKETRKAWEHVAQEHEWIDSIEELRPWMTLEQASLLWFQLQTVEDSEEAFPRGKSASLQALEELIYRGVRE